MSHIAFWGAGDLWVNGVQQLDKRFVHFMLSNDVRDDDYNLSFDDGVDPDPAVHHPAALAWRSWEDVHVSLTGGYQPSLRYEDQAFRLCLARLVTHYWANAAFLEEDHLLQNAAQLTDIPTYISHGRLDISSPMDFPVEIAEAIPGSELFIAGSDGHGGASITNWTISATDRLADTSSP